MRKIAIDQDVWAFLQKHARPLEDSPNSVLRRILLKDDSPPELKQRRREATKTLTPSIVNNVFRLTFLTGEHKEWKLPKEKVGPHISRLFADVNSFIRGSGGTDGQVSGIRYHLHKAGYYVRGPIL